MLYLAVCFCPTPTALPKLTWYLVCFSSLDGTDGFDAMKNLRRDS